MSDDAHLSPMLNRLPEQVNTVHLMGICGTGMAALAGMLRDMGYGVTGSDQDIYPPMSDFLEGMSIPVKKGYGPENLHPAPDLVVVGNVITARNPEALELERLGLSYLSFPQALRRFAIGDKHSIVVSGTHGKTTTTSMAAWLLNSAGMDPGFMVGGIPLNFERGFRVGGGDQFVIEGDEYDTAFFDKGPKFLHYNPGTVILTGIEFDHADIYRDLDHVVRSFRKLIASIPPGGLLIANGDDDIVLRECTRATCRVRTYGFSPKNRWRAADMTKDGVRTRFTVFEGEKPRLNLAMRLYGAHNVQNALSVVALSDALGIAPHAATGAFDTFLGVKRRQEVVGEPSGIVVVDDFAHHPTAVRETLAGVRQWYEGRRLIAVFEPRSNSSRRNVFQQSYARSFDQADLVLIPEPKRMEGIPPAERFSSRRLVRDLVDSGRRAVHFGGTDLLLDALEREARPGDVVLFMSNGGFDDLPRRLLKRIEHRPLGTEHTSKIKNQKSKI